MEIGNVTKQRIEDFTQEQAARYLDDARADMAVYMQDFISDLMEKGMDEAEAYAKACERAFTLSRDVFFSNSACNANVSEITSFSMSNYS